MLPDLSTVRVIAYDSETSGLDDDAYICGHVITWSTNPKDSIYLPVRHAGGGNLDVEKITGWVRELLARPDLTVIMHNARFDLKMLYRDNITVEGAVVDTAGDAALIDENQKGFSLARCCEEMGVQAKKGQPMYEHLAGVFGGEAVSEQMSNFHKLAGNDPVAVDYATGDGTSTLQLWEKQQVQIDAQELRAVHKMECKLIKTIHRSAMRGIRVDVDRLDQVQEQIESELALASAEIDFINTGSGKQVKAWLEEQKERGETVLPWPTTKPTSRHPAGQPSFPSKYLRKFPVGEKVADVKQLSKLSTAFINPLKEKHIKGNLVFPTFRATKSDLGGTGTGRLSCADPNLQQVHKRNKRLGMLFRQVFLPPEGMVWYEQDYKSAEYRMFAHFSRSQKLIDDFNLHGLDLHDTVKEMLGVDRDFAKNMNFGILFGMGDPSLAGHVGVSLQEAKNYRRMYFERIPEAKVMMERAAGICREFGYVKTILGRRRRWAGRDRYSKDYQAINAVCQGSIGDVIKMKMIEIDEYMESESEGDYGFSVHDAQCFWAPEGETQTPLEVQRISESFPDGTFAKPLRVKLPVETGQGVNWARASYEAKYWIEHDKAAA